MRVYMHAHMDIHPPIHSYLGFSNHSNTQVEYFFQTNWDNLILAADLWSCCNLVLILEKKIFSNNFYLQEKN